MSFSFRICSDFSKKPKFQTENFTIFLDLKPKFPEFHGPSWTSGGNGGYVANYAHVYAKHYRYEKSVATCIYHPDNDPYCPRFRLKDIVLFAEKDFTDDFTDDFDDFTEIAAYVRCFSEFYDRKNYFKYYIRVVNSRSKWIGHVDSTGVVIYLTVCHNLNFSIEQLTKENRRYCKEMLILPR